MSKPKIIGNLVIVAYKARDLPNREIVGKQDPFVVFRIGDIIQKTITDIGGGQHPKWDDQVTLPIPENKKLVLVQVYDEDKKRQELISEFELDVNNVIKEGEEDGREAGKIYLELTFYAAAPPPKRQPTRFGMSKKLKPPVGYIPAVPSPSNAPYPAASPQNPPPSSGFIRPAAAPVPVKSQSTSTYQSSSPYPPHHPQQQQQQQRPPLNFGANLNTPRPYPPPNPTPSMSTGSQHPYYPPQQQQQQQHVYPPANGSRPVSIGGQPFSSLNVHHRPSSPPGPGSTNFDNASLLSSSYNPQPNTGRPNYGSNGGHPPSTSNGGYPPNHGYPPPQQNNNAGNRNSYPGYTSSPYPPQQQQLGFPEPQQLAGGYIPHSGGGLGTPFAAHQGAFPPTPNNNGYPPQQQQQQQHQGGGYPPSGYSGY
ncbi:hypothetical protein [Parasitella parasitica]|uniref:C2 domain-containing protein n=1 Tax=Parasitella parasitica TaxID=35722 RepID=A0A0B7NWN3_9FUNG|nr:hypothetical protein [Parasitella parasitica]